MCLVYFPPFKHNDIPPPASPPPTFKYTADGAQGKRVGGGTYADVFLGHHISDPKNLVAIKRIKLNKEYKDGMALDAVREIKFLSELSHPNILKLHAVYLAKAQNVSLVLEYLPHGDLEKLWQDHSITYTAADIKAWGLMISQAVWFLHENRILHRDIKSNNVLIGGDNTLKLADFGLARAMADPGRPMTCNVITLFYRPPELIYGARHYGGKVDVWSVACVLAELAVRDFVFKANTDIEQLSNHCEMFGHPTDETWPGVSKLPNYIAPAGTSAKKAQPMVYWRSRFGLLGEDGIDLLRGMWSMDPQKRLSSKQVLEHRYWMSAPKPTGKDNLPRKKKDEKKVGEELKRGPGNLDSGRADKVARKLDFSAMRQ